MATTAAEQVNALEQSADHGFEVVQNINGLRQKRSQIHTLLDQFERNQMATSDTIREYRKAAEKDSSEQGLEGFYGWIQEKWQEAGQRLADMQQQIETGIRQKIMSEKDRDFLMSRLILTNEHDFIGEVDQIEDALKGKIERLKKDHEDYDEIRNNPLAQSGEIVVSHSSKIKIPDEKTFLDMAVPERRKLLDKAKSALPKAKHNAESNERAESAEQDRAYKRLLDNALKQKIIGRKTHQKFWEEFQKLDNEDKAYWIDEFDNQMRRYETLWQQIRSTLNGESLSEIESKQDELGYTQLLTLFGNLKANESLKLTDDYKAKMKNFVDEGVISKHTYNEFLQAFQHQSLETQYNWLDQLDDEMKPYQALAQQEAQLAGKHKKILDHFWNQWGFTERQDFLSDPDDSSYQDALDQARPKGQDILDSFTDDGVVEAIEEANEHLNKKGQGTKNTFIGRVRHMFERKSREQSDEADFHDQLQEARSESKNKPTENTKEEPAADAGEWMDMQSDIRQKREGANKPDEQPDDEIGGEAGIDLELDQAQVRDARVIEDEGFDQVEEWNEKNQKQRVTRVEVNREKGLNHFIAEDSRNEYRSKQEGGSDDLKIAIRRRDGAKSELSREDVKTMLDYMEEADDLDEAA